MDITNFAITQTIALTIIVGLERIAKKFNVKDKYIPILDMIFGIIIGIMFFSTQGIKYGIIIGVILGLEACGLFGSINNCIDCIKKDKQ